MLALVATITVLVTAGKAAGQAVSCQFGGAFDQCVGPVAGQVTQNNMDHRLVIALAAAMTTAPLVLRRIRPLTAFWLIVATALVSPHVADNVITLVAVVVAAYSAVVHSRYRVAAMVSVPLAGVLVATAFPTVAEPLRLTGRATALWALIPVVIAGQAVHQWRQRASDSQARLDLLQEEHTAATVQALAMERARIARELHDVVTHNVSVMIVQAGAARQVLTDSPGDAKASLLAVESSGRAAMAELRHLLGLLSPAAENAAGEGASGEDAAAVGEHSSADLQPQPGLGQLPSLIGRVRAAGLELNLQLAGALPVLPPGLDLTAYRLIQEALTNVIKHAGPTRASVSVEYADGDLIVAVTDAGPREPALARSPTAVPGAGRGLLGLRERVALYGGEVTAGPGTDGGWRVSARLPVHPEPTAPAPLAPATEAVAPARASSAPADSGLASSAPTAPGLAAPTSGQLMTDPRLSAPRP